MATVALLLIPNFVTLTLLLITNIVIVTIASFHIVITLIILCSFSLRVLTKRVVVTSVKLLYKSENQNLCLLIIRGCTGGGTKRTEFTVETIHCINEHVLENTLENTAILCYVRDKTSRQIICT